ncbi:MAG: ABC transporter substrate-binding protein, partial [Betaproteobacteria bacterium]
MSGFACIAIAATSFAAADPNKVVRIAFPTAETGFDPVKVFDLYSATVNEAIFDRLLTYEYLTRPSKLAPMVSESMPEVSDEGRTYVFHLKKGIYFTPDPAFRGVKRELVAQDFVYSIMRFADPANRSQYAFLIEGKIKGLDALAAAAKKSGKFDYDARLSDLTAVDRYTLKVQLSARDYNFPFVVAHTAFGAVAREVIEAYASDTMAHPVGTGPYQLKEWKRGTKITLDANPGFPSFTWDSKPTPGSVWDEEVVAKMKGRTMPAIGRVEISIIDEDQSRWLAFNQ